MSKKLFQEVAPENMDGRILNCFQWLASAGIHTTAWRFIPTGRVTLVMHDGAEPKPETLQDAADYFLLTCETGSRQ